MKTNAGVCRRVVVPLARRLAAFIWLVLAVVPALTLHAQLPRGVLFSDDFEAAASVSPYTIAQQQATHSLATDSDPNPAQVGSWSTYGGEADGGPGLFGVQVTSNVDPSYMGSYQSNNVLRIFRSPAGNGSAAAAPMRVVKQVVDFRLGAFH